MVGLVDVDGDGAGDPEPAGEGSVTVGVGDSEPVGEEVGLMVTLISVLDCFRKA